MKLYLALNEIGEQYPGGSSTYWIECNTDDEPEPEPEPEPGDPGIPVLIFDWTTGEYFPAIIPSKDKDE